MKFYDRKKEMAILYAAKKQSQTSACFTVMTGRRRIGKTALLLESVKDTRFVYIFVARKSEVLLCAQYQPVIQETLGIRIYGEIREFAQLFELLMQHSQKENFTLIIDEFQEFLYINPSIVSDIQRICGTSFGAPECIRMSYATSDENIVEAIRRIKEALAKLK